MRRKEFYRKCLRCVLILLAAGLSFQCSEENPLAPDVRAANEVWITANGFEPATLAVSAGTTVVWINKDGEIHTVNSGEPNMFDGMFISPAIRPNGSFSHQFDTKGTFDYYCAVTLATGKIIVN